MPTYIQLSLLPIDIDCGSSHDATDYTRPEYTEHDEDYDR